MASRLIGGVLEPASGSTESARLRAMKTLASAPAALEAYLSFGAALGAGTLDAKFREQISIAVAQANSCEYCLSAHATIGKMVGLTPDEIAGSRKSHAEDAKRHAGLQLAQAIVVQRGEVSDAALANARTAGYTDGEITEIVANVAVNIFTNYFNSVAHTDIDFPILKPGADAPARP